MSWAAPEDLYLSTSLASYLDSKNLSLSLSMFLFLYVISIVNLIGEFELMAYSL